MTLTKDIVVENRSMRNDYALGKYSLSFLEIFINSDSATLSQFTTENIKTLFHEYIHFLQDISTYYGIYNAALSLQEMALRLRHAAACTKEVQLKKFKIPGKYKKQFDEHELSFGDLCEKDYSKHFYFSRILGVENGCLKAELVDKHTDAEITRLLGSIHILEGMADCLESCIFGETSSPYLPYKVLRDVANVTLKRILPPKEFINLCEFSLQCVVPGHAFNFSLQEMAKGRSILDLIDNEELAGVSGKKFNTRNAAHVLYSSDEMKEAFYCVFKDVYRHKIKKFIDSFFTNGVQERAVNFFFISDMTNETELTIFNKLIYFFDKFGVPNIFTNNSYIGCRSIDDETNHDSILLSFLRYFYDEIKKDNIPKSCFLQNDCREKFNDKNIVSRPLKSIQHHGIY